MISTILKEDFDRILDAVTPSLKRLSGKAILVTGACGLVGSYILEFLAYINDHGISCRVVGFDNLSASKESRQTYLSLKKNVRVMESVDITKPMGRVLRDEVCPDYILNMASIASPAIYKRFPRETINVNTVGVTNMVSGFRRRMPTSVLHFSSSEIYGEPDIVPTPEDYPGRVSSIGPRACYDESKRMGETLCIETFRQEGVPIKIVRPFNLYGPGHFLDDGRVIPQIMNAVLSNRTIPLTIYGSGMATRSFCYLSDAVVQLFAVLLDGNDGEVYNVGDYGSEISMNDLGQLVTILFPDTKIQRDVDSAEVIGAPTRRRPDTKKVMEISNPTQVTIAQGLSRTKAWHEEGETI